MRRNLPEPLRQYWTKAIIVGGLLLAFAALIATALLVIPGEDAPRPGSQGPPVLAEYVDFHCSHCANFAAVILPRIQERFTGPGLIRLEIRHFPFLPGSKEAAVAAECAREQGHFGEYHDLLFQNVHQGIPHDYDALARAAGLGQEPFQRCLESDSPRTRVQSDAEQGRREGVRGTPALTLNGRLLQWNSYQDLERQIQEEIER